MFLKWKAKHFAGGILHAAKAFLFPFLFSGKDGMEYDYEKHQLR